MVEVGLSKNRIIAELARSPHGKLSDYIPIAKQAAVDEAEFYAHLCVWNLKNSQVRDSLIALPAIGLAVPGFDPEYVDSSLACLATQNVRQLLRAYRFALEMRAAGLKPRMTRLKKVIGRYLRDLESNWARWTRVAVQHREDLKELYALTHMSRSAVVGSILFGGERGPSGHGTIKAEYPRGTVFAKLRDMKSMSALEIAGTIMEEKIPFLIAAGALGEKMKDEAVVLALIERMTPAELVNNTKMLERLGVKTVPALRAAYEQGLQRAAKSKKGTLKATRAVEAAEDMDEGLKEKLKALQEKQINALGGVDGNWLVLGDMSGSMSRAIDLSRQVAATLARMVKGKVWMVFFNTMPRGIEVTGMTYEQIKEKTRGVVAGGGTSIGCGLLGMMEAGVEVDGIAVVSDGGENTAPYFNDVYKRYSERFGKMPPVYLYRMEGESDAFTGLMQRSGFDVQKFDLSSGTDFYALPNLISTMRVQRYGLVQEILDTPLLKLDDVLKPTRKELATA